MQTYESLRAEHTATEAKLQIGVSRLSSWSPLGLSATHSSRLGWLEDISSSGNSCCVCASSQDTMRQQEWKIGSLTKENRTLELANTELRSQLQTWKQENLEVGGGALGQLGQLGAGAWVLGDGIVQPFLCSHTHRRLACVHLSFNLHDRSPKRLSCWMRRTGS
jgi:hypothetical protein